MKKFLALMTIVCMVLTASVAFAAFPSKTAEDLTQVGTVESTTGVEVDPTFAIVVAEPTEEINAEVEAMRELVEAEQPLLTYFPEEVQQEVVAAMPETFDANTAVAYEVVTVAAANYDETYGDVAAEFTFATEFAEETKVVVLIGLPNAEGGMDWVVKSGVVVNGAVRIEFTKDELVLMQSENALMVIMSAPIA